MQRLPWRIPVLGDVKSGEYSVAARSLCVLGLWN